MMPSKTIFQKIIDREIPARIAYEDEQCIALHDIQPQAPVHVLVIPKKVIQRLSLTTAEDEALLGRLMQVVPKIAAQLGIQDGFRVVINNGTMAGETVPHLHIHVLGGRSMGWPPG